MVEPRCHLTKIDNTIIYELSFFVKTMAQH